MGYDHVEHFRKHGYAVIRGAFRPPEVEELANAFDRVQAKALDLGRSYRHQNVFFRLTDDPTLGSVVRMVQWPAYFDPVLARNRTDARFRRLLAPLIGSNLKQIINQMHWKTPGASNGEFGYHQDIRSRRPREAYLNPAHTYVQTGIAIDPHRRDNGCMTVLPGSHRLGELRFHAGPTLDRNLSDDDLRAAGLDPAEKVDLLLEPGDLALWHVFLVHGSGPNTTSMDRRFLINGYVEADHCCRGEWAFRDGKPCELGEPVLVHYEELYAKPGPFFVD